MIRLTAYISGRVQRVGYRAKVVSLAEEMGLAGIVQNQPDGRVLVVAEGEKKEDLERFASAIRIENALIHVDDLSAEYAQGTGQYSSFRKITGPNEVGERLDDGIEILKRMLDKQDQTISVLSGMDKKLDRMLDKQDETTEAIRDLTTITKDLTTITKDGFENLGGKQDQMLDKQDETTEAIRDLKHSDERFIRMEKDIRTIKSKLSIR